jgi:sulfoxide reductase heme-binding subunit YedZ
MKKNIFKRIEIHYLPMFGLSVIFCLIFYLLWKPTLPIVPFITYTSGYLSIFLLAVSLLLGPINLLLKIKNPISTNLRRDIGVFGGLLGLIHSVVGLFMHFTGRPWLYTGLLGAFILILLVVISNDYFLRKLKAAKWKNLQRFTYLMFVLVIAHCIFYRLNADKIDLIIYLYLPMFLTILAFQLIGIRLKTRKNI